MKQWCCGRKGSIFQLLKTWCLFKSPLRTAQQPPLPASLPGWDLRGASEIKSWLYLVCLGSNRGNNNNPCKTKAIYPLTSFICPRTYELFLLSFLRTTNPAPILRKWSMLGEKEKGTNSSFFLSFLPLSDAFCSAGSHYAYLAYLVAIKVSLRE